MTDTKAKDFGILSGSTLKLIACIAMFVDHFGLIIYPTKMIFRIIGRLAFPMFAYFIAEGCKYTRNKLKHFLLLFSVGVVYFFFYLYAFESVYPSVFLTFSVSILNVYLLQRLKEYVFNTGSTAAPNGSISTDVVKDTENTDETNHRVKFSRVLIAVFVFLCALGISYIPFHFAPFDYGYIGMLAPVLISLFDFSKVDAPSKLKSLDSKAVRLLFLAIICVSLAIRNPALKTELFGFRFTIQVFNLFSLPLLALYNGKAGTKKLKYFFYAFYPLHLGIIIMIKIIIDIAAM